MLNNTLEIIKKIESYGYETYIVGGFVRDYYLGKETFDIDICTNAKTDELINIFDNIKISNSYGSITLIENNIRYEITTYREEDDYDDHRRPNNIKYINNLLDDLKRRDFTINTLCLNSKGELIDLLKAKDDLDKRIIKTVIEPNISFNKDVLRILRAVRFATILDFKIDSEVKEAIKNNAHTLKELSYVRKKEELSKIFGSANVNYGLSLIKELELDKYLELNNIDNLVVINNNIGIWAQLDVADIYPFTKREKDLINNIKECLLSEYIDKYLIYKKGIDVINIVCDIKGIDKDQINNLYNNLPIKNRNDIKINISKLIKLFNKEPNDWINKLYEKIEIELINGNLINEETEIINYIKENNVI